MLSRRLLRIKVIKALYSHFQSDSDSLIVSEKNLAFGIDKAYELYHLLMVLIVDVQQYAAKRVDIGKAKMLPTAEDLNPNTRFIDNKVVAQIAGSDSLLNYLTAKSLSWGNYPELIKKLYNNMVESDYYKKYMSSPKNNYESDKKFVIDFFTNEIEDFEALSDTLEEQSIYWVDDIEFGLIMVIKTIQGMKSSDLDLDLLPEYKNQDDKEFARDLFRAALVNHVSYFNYIDEHTKNWDLERIAFMDRVIMLATVAEILNFPTIPIKVTLDEFIEISKYYSTPASSTFINGVLDKIVETLHKEGKIGKEGRGLVS